MLGFLRWCQKRGEQDMGALGGRCVLCSVLLLVGGTLAVRVQIQQDSVNGTVGQSVLLNISYTLDGASQLPLSIRWTFRDFLNMIIACTVLNCSLDAGGAASNCSATCFIPSMKRGRAEFFPNNGSLLLQDLKLSDSGVYVVTFKEPPQSWSITLAVHEQRFLPEHPHEDPEFGGGGRRGSASHIPCYIFGGCYCFILLVLQLLLHLPRLRPSSWQASDTESRSVPDTERRQRRPQPGAAPLRG